MEHQCIIQLRGCKAPTTLATGFDAVGNHSVQWTINPTVGQISAGGLYTPPNQIAAAQAITVTSVNL